MFSGISLGSFLLWEPRRKQHRLAGWQGRVEDSRVEGGLGWTQVLVTSTHTVWRQQHEYLLPGDTVSLLDEFFCVCMLASSQKQHRSKTGEQMCATKELGHRLMWHARMRLSLTVTTYKPLMLDSFLHWKRLSSWENMILVILNRDY